MPDYTLGDTVYKRFSTRAFATGAPTTLAGTPVVSAYEDDSAVQITAGITLGVDHDGVTGLNLLTISATGGNGFEAGKSYDLVITTGTVDSVSVVGEVVWHFTLGAEAAAVDLANGTDGLGALKTLLDDIPTVSEFNARTLTAASYFDPAADTVANVTTVATSTNLTNLPSIPANWITAAGVAASALDGKGDWSTHAALDVWHVTTASIVTASTIGLQLKTNVDAVLTDRTLAAASYFDPAADTVATVTTLTGHTPQTGDSFARLGAPAGASVSADVAAIQTDTDDIQLRLPSALTTGTADSGTALSMVDAARTESDANYWAGSWIRFTSGTIAGQTRLITSFTPATDTMTFEPATTQSVGTNTYEIIPAGATGIDWGRVVRPATAVDLSATDIQLCDTITTYTGDTPQTGDNFARLGAPAGASVSADIAAIEAQTDDIGAAGAGLTAIPWNAAWDAEVESEVNDALDTAIAELGVGAPTATPTIRAGLMLLYMALRNKTVVQTSGTDALEIYNNAGTKIAAKLLTDDGSDYTEAQMA